jgi:DNA-binding beta-propeller fold protein YncE
MKNYLQVFQIFPILIFLVQGCKPHHTDPEPDTGYPDDVHNIVINKCATAGCHNTQSKMGAGGLDLSSWQKLFEGGKGGAVIIPYRPDFSTFCYYTNTDTNSGLVLVPNMPYNAAPLPAHEYTLLKNWIQNGAPAKNGFIKWSDYQNKSKLYITNRGCDVVTVMDPATGLAMRYVDVGSSPGIEGPCMIKVAPDKKHWYVIFNPGTIIQKFRTSDNVKVGELNISQGFWSSLCITGDSKKAFIADANFSGRILCVNLENMQVITSYDTGLTYPFGLCINNANDRLYATSKEGNFIYRIDIYDLMNPVIQEISLETGVSASTVPTLNPYHILLSNDETKYFVTCQKSSELRILQASNDSLLTTVSVTSNPAEMVTSSSHPYLFISCLGVPGSGKVSMINVFDFAAGTILPEIYAGFDSKGIMIDQASGKLFVANRNVSAGGPAAHHEPVCDGKNGYITAIDINTLQLVPGFKTELSVEPYHIAK